MKLKIELSDEVVEQLEKYPAQLKDVVEFIINRDFKKQIRGFGRTDRFNNTTKEGILTRTYYYQKQKYGLNETKEEFIKKWKRDKTFKHLFKQYKNFNFARDMMPSFVRDEEGNLQITEFSNRKYFK